MFIQVHRLIAKCLIATFLLGTCGSVMFFSPSITHAENSAQSQIEELIKSLLVQIAALQAQLGQGQTLEGGDKGESFSIGDQVRTTNTLNLRASAGTGGLFIKTLPANTKGTIVGGPESKNGYLWWKVSYNGVIGWSAHNWLSATGKYTIPKDITTLPPRDESLSVRIVTPISGSYEYGEKITVSWEQTGSAPSGSKACVTMRNVEKKKHFAFPSTGGCIDVVGDEPVNTLTGEIVRTSGYDLPPGKYKFFVTIKGPSNADGKDGAQLATARDVGTFIIKDDAKGEFAAISNVTNGENPVITGTATNNVSEVSVVIANLSGDTVYESGLIPVTNNNWSHKVTTDLVNGSYGFKTYIDDDLVHEFGATIINITDPNVLVKFKAKLNGGLISEISDVTKQSASDSCKEIYNDYAKYNFMPGDELKCYWNKELFFTANSWKG
jgi:uncharacterized protein YraI